MSLEITKEKVLEASKQSSEAKKVLETLFPEVFKPQNMIIEPFELTTDGTKMIFIGKELAPSGLSEKCIILSRKYNWEYKEFGVYRILIPTTK